MAASEVYGAELTFEQARSSSVLQWLDQPPPTLLVADPDPASSDVLDELCLDSGASLVSCGDGAEALFQIGCLAPAVVVMSAELPVVPAPDVIAALRRHTSVPIAVGVRAGESHRAASVIVAGATEILSWPYQRRELQSALKDFLTLAKIRFHQEAVIALGDLRLNSVAYEVLAAGRPLRLTAREFELLRFLILHADRVVTSDQIRHAVWGARGADVSANTIAVYVGRLRARLGGAAQLIHVRGVGYRLAPAPDKRRG